jgi:MFS family permease
VTLCCTAAVKDFAGLTAIRTLLGCFEAVITPSLILITASWYTKKQSTPRYGIWYCGLGVGQIVGGLISFCAQSGPKNITFAGWRIMMISVGVFNLIVATAVILYLPDSVASAKFLTPHEKTFIAYRISADQSGNGKRVFKMAGLWEALRDLQVWLLFVNTILIGIPSGVITTFSATLIAGFGYTPKQGALLNMPSGVVSIFATLLCTFAVQRGIARWIGIVALMVPTMIGAGLMSFLPKTNKGGVLAGIYLLNFDVAPLALIYALVGSNTQGYTKKIVSTTMVAIAFSLANIIGPQTFRTKEAPGYISAKITIFGVNGGCILVTIMLRLLYGYRNKKNAKCAVVEGMDGDEDMTDMSNPAFKYVY